MRGFLRDLRYGVRRLARTPGFTALAAVTIALGAGANAGMFSVIYAQLWRPLPFAQPADLALVQRSNLQHPGPARMLSAPDFRDWLPQARQEFSGICAFAAGQRYLLRHGPATIAVSAESVSSDFFRALGMPPVVGRGFSPEEMQPGHSHVIVLTYQFWQREFAADPAVIGQTVAFDNANYTVVGVAPANLRFEFFGDRNDFYTPLVLDALDQHRGSQSLFVIARRRPGQDWAAIQSRVSLDAQRLASQSPGDAGRGLVLSDLRDSFTVTERQGLLYFAGVAVLVLLIACFNLAGLLLARGLGRRHEFAVRAALGAPPAAVARQMLAEGVCLGLVSGPLAVGCAYAGARIFDLLLPGELLGRQVAPELDWRVLALALSLATVAAVAAMLAPAILISRAHLEASLRDGGRGRSLGRATGRMRSSLMVAEIALVVALLFASGIFLHSLIAEMRAPLGFNGSDVTTINFLLPASRYSAPAQIEAGSQAILERIRRLPSVTGVALASEIPFRCCAAAAFSVAGAAGKPAAGSPATAPSAMLVAADPDYRKLLEIPLVAGRWIAAGDGAGALPVAVINRTLAQRYFAGTNPIGAQLDLRWEWDTAWEPPVAHTARVQVVGVVADTHVFGPNEVPFNFVYLASAQAPERSLYLLARTAAGMHLDEHELRAALQGFDSNIVAGDYGTMEERADLALRGARGELGLVAFFAGLAAVLAAIGIFGMASWFVEQRRSEFGIRMALGASRAHIFSRALREAGTIGAAGVAAGLALGVLTTQALRSTLYLEPGRHPGMLYGVAPNDPLALVAAALLFLTVFLAGAFLPARRATSIDPLAAIRSE